MLTIVVSGTEGFDEKTQEFYTVEAKEELQLEHSLLSLSKWEAIWHKPFLDIENKTTEETMSYIRCMAINKKPDSKIFDRLSTQNIQEIKNYIKDPMTATTINERGPKSHNSEKVTSELIYYWMISYGIPFECEKWHLSRLMTLIRVCGVKQAKPQKMKQRDILSQHAALNAQRRAKYGTRG